VPGLAQCVLSLCKRRRPRRKPKNVSFLQFLRDGGELLEGGFEVGGDDVGVGEEVGGVFEAFVFEPEDVEIGVGFPTPPRYGFPFRDERFAQSGVAFHQVVAGEGFEALAFFAAVLPGSRKRDPEFKCEKRRYDPVPRRIWCFSGFARAGRLDNPDAIAETRDYRASPLPRARQKNQH